MSFRKVVPHSQKTIDRNAFQTVTRPWLRPFHHALSLLVRRLRHTVALVRWQWQGAVGIALLATIGFFAFLPQQKALHNSAVSRHKKTLEMPGSLSSAASHVSQPEVVPARVPARISHPISGIPPVLHSPSVSPLPRAAVYHTAAHPVARKVYRQTVFYSWGKQEQEKNKGDFKHKGKHHGKHKGGHGKHGGEGDD